MRVIVSVEDYGKVVILPVAREVISFSWVGTATEMTARERERVDERV